MLLNQCDPSYFTTLKDLEMTTIIVPWLKEFFANLNDEMRKLEKEKPGMANTSSLSLQHTYPTKPINNTSIMNPVASTTVGIGPHTSMSSMTVPGHTPLAGASRLHSNAVPQFSTLDFTPKNKATYMSYPSSHISQKMNGNSYVYKSDQDVVGPLCLELKIFNTQEMIGTPYTERYRKATMNSRICFSEDSVVSMQLMKLVDAIRDTLANTGA